MEFFSTFAATMSWEGTIITLTFACCATAHFVGMCITGILARHRVQYLSLVAMLAIFFCVIAIVAMYGENVAHGNPGLLNPYMLLMLVVGTYLQSIYSLGIMMPGYLQWGRMVRYASPIFVLGIAYVVAMYPYAQLTKVYSAAELFDNIFSLDFVLRILALLLGVYYVLNILVLPHRLAFKAVFPVSLIAYVVLLFLSVILYLYTALDYHSLLLCAYMVLFTLVNFFWVCHSMEMLVIKMPHPDISLGVDGQAELAESAAEDSREDEQKQVDFNEANQRRYLQVQVWMQRNRDKWTSNGFTRDRLCEETGINRQLMLQCLRSQGHNNVHEYITAYRVQELKRLIARGEVRGVADALVVGFGSIKTARLCFERIEGCGLDDFLTQKVRVD
ncbi:MAG: hypothetical protein NC208_02885 [Bacteroides sp.]|nr:hypothetical protein [Bacteroides sp.]